MTDHLMELVLIVALGVGAQWIAYRTRLPSILLLLTFGFLVGPVAERFLGGRWLDPDALFGRDVLFGIVSVSVAVILFEGGMSLKLGELRRVGSAVGQMVSVAVVVALVGATAAAHFIAGFDFGLALLLGSILVVTGPTVITPMLKQIKPTANVASVLKWEGIVNDPTGAILAVLVFEAIATGELHDPSMHLVWTLLLTLGVGVGLGLAGAAVLIVCLRRFWIPDALEISAILMMVLLTFAASNAIAHEAGLLAVTIMGLALGNQKWAEVHHVMEFKENLASLLVGMLFILLAARFRVEDVQLLHVGSLLCVGALILVVRPLTVFLATGWTGLSWREKAFIAWMAPRGVVAAAVTSLFALRLEQIELPEPLASQVAQLTPFMFLVILSTIVVYGLSAWPLARWLRVSVPNPQGLLIISADRFSRAFAEVLEREGIRTLLVDSNLSKVRAAKMAGARAWHGDVLAGHRNHELDLLGIGKALLLTPNDRANTFIALNLVSEFGREKVYRVQPAQSTAAKKQSGSPGYARIFIDRTMTLAELERRLDEGWVIKATKITEEFDYDAMLARYNDLVLPLAVIDDEERLILGTADAPLEPEPGHSLISLLKESRNDSEGARASLPDSGSAG